MTFTEFDRGPEIPVLKPIERKVWIMEDRSRRNEGSRQKGRSVGSPVLERIERCVAHLVARTSRN